MYLIKNDNAIGDTIEEQDRVRQTHTVVRAFEIEIAGIAAFTDQERGRRLSNLAGSDKDDRRLRLQLSASVGEVGEALEE